MIYSDRGTGADTDLAVFEPVIPDGFFMVGHFAQPNHQGSMNGTVPLVKPLDPAALAAPVGFESYYSDRGSGGDQDVTFFRVIPPAGYVALGDIVAIGYAPNPPAYVKNIYRCVRQDLVKQGEFNRSVWTDKGSGADKDGSVWYVHPTTEGVTGYFKVQSGYSIPSAYLAQCLHG